MISAHRRSAIKLLKKEDDGARHLASPNSALGDAAPLNLMGN
jgi:hypothetical protein